MEDTARLAVLEQNTGDAETFNKTLDKLLWYVAYILENPDNFELRTIRSELLSKSLDIDGFPDYLKYIGFQINNKEIIYPKDQSLSRLHTARAAIERKLHFSGTVTLIQNVKSSCSQPRLKKVKLLPGTVLKTDNEFLLKLEMLFNDVLKYEDEELQRVARQHVPLVALQLRAMERLRQQQRTIKTGDTTAPDMSFDVALLLELLRWFKQDFFSWVDSPDCDKCGGGTTFQKNGTLTTDTETCRLEIYKCVTCGAREHFPRYNNPRALLRSRRGRCGEWANCFALIARAVGYETRYVHDVTDHVWCEVFDHDSKRWLHADPSEAQLDTPLMYENGWGKKLQYVIAFSRDDIQDVTWRYSSKHALVRARRTLCDEGDLIAAIMQLREHRQRQVSEPRRRYLVHRGLEELVQLMVERKPSDYESHGRISGSAEWRAGRGELGNTSHTYQLHNPGEYAIRYYTGSDLYRVYHNGQEIQGVKGWARGVFASSNVFRKEETDWKMVYLARDEGATTGSVSWRLSSDSQLTSLSIRAVSKLYETGHVVWSLQFDGEDSTVVELGDTPQSFPRRFKQATLTAMLSGGGGSGVSWQHAQLFRQSMSEDSCGLEILVRCE